MDLRPLSSSPQFQVSSFWRIYLMRLTQICKRCLTISETPTRPTSAFHTFRGLTWTSSNVKHGWHVWWRLDPDWSRAGLDGECWILFPLLDDCDSCDNVERYTVLHSVTQTTVILIRHHQPVFYLPHCTALSWTSLAANVYVAIT